MCVALCASWLPSVQDRGIRLMQVHTELLGVLYCGQRAVFWGSLPALPSIRATNLLRLWDYEGLLSGEVHHTASCNKNFCSAHWTPCLGAVDCGKRPIKYCLLLFSTVTGRQERAVICNQLRAEVAAAYAQANAVTQASTKGRAGTSWAGAFAKVRSIHLSRSALMPAWLSCRLLCKLPAGDSTCDARQTQGLKPFIYTGSGLIV